MKIAIVGKGMMGRLIREMAEEIPGVEAVYTIEPARGESLFDVPKPDVIIDFSHPDALEGICAYVKAQKSPVGIVFGTTGFTEEQEAAIAELSSYGPVIKSYNYSYGINTLKKLLGYGMPLLARRADIEIVEKHHNHKVDAPSGTALMLAEICDPAHEKAWVCGRQGESRRGDELGIHSIRGGTIFGEHDVIFALKDEVIEIRHTAFSTRIFAKGAIEAALWLNGKKKGMYSIEDVFY